MKHFIYISGFALMLGVAGCAVGPEYRRPAALHDQAVPGQFTDRVLTNGVAWKIARPSASLPRGAWWQIFGDGELNRLESMAITNNQNLAAAAARFEQARELVGAVRSQFLPQLKAGGTPGGDVTRQRSSANAPVQGKAAGTSYTFDSFSAPVYLGWELDLWGRVRRLSEAARSRFAASVDDFESARLAVTAEVAADYFKLRTLDEEYALLSNTLGSYRRSLELTQNRRRGGVVSDLDVAQAATQLHAAEAQLPAIELRRAQVQHALAILCGQSPVDFSVSAGAVTSVVPEVPASLPAELLEHRPDIAAGERRMAAANADVGVAKAAFFPAIKFNGFAGYQSVSSDSLFSSPSRVWAVGPSLELPLFTGGLNRAKHAAARAAYDETVATYRQTVLKAFGEVEDELAAQHLLTQEWKAGTEAAATAHRALEIANHRYKAGLVTYLAVAVAETEALNHDRNVVQLQGARLATSVNLIKALGCGWQAPDDAGRR